MEAKAPFGEKIRILRIALGLKQDWLAKKIGFSQKTISKLETNSHAMPLGKDRIARIANAFGVEPHELIQLEIYELLKILPLPKTSATDRVLIK